MARQVGDEVTVMLQTGEEDAQPRPVTGTLVAFDAHKQMWQVALSFGFAIFYKESDLG